MLFHRIIEPISNFNNKTIIFLHGLWGNNKNLNIVGLDKKFSNYKKVFIDLPNHSKSPHYNKMIFPFLSEKVMEFIDDKNFNKNDLIIVGHSLGGKVGMDLLNNNFGEKLVCLDIGPIDYRKRGAKMYNMINKLSNIEFISKGIIKSYSEVEKEVYNISKYLEDDDSKRKILTSFLLTNISRNKENNLYYFSSNMKIIARDYNEWISYDMNNSKIYKKVLFIKGNNSNYITENDYDQIKKIFPNFDFNDLKSIDGGHWIHYVNPIETVKYIHEYIEN